jgi:hypothetical protein
MGHKNQQGLTACLMCNDSSEIFIVSSSLKTFVASLTLGVNQTARALGIRTTLHPRKKNRVGLGLECDRLTVTSLCKL